VDMVLPGARKVDAVTLTLVVLLSAFTLAAAGSSGRERAKRIVCLAHLKQLTSAWIAYADQNNGRIVNGAAGFHYLSYGMTSDGKAANIVERAWVGKSWGQNWNNAGVGNTGVTKAQAKVAIQEGALWPLVGDERLYKCPVGKPYEWVTYAIVDAMNGLYMGRGPVVSTGVNHPDVLGKKIGETVLFLKNRAEIVSPPPAERMVFIDEGAATPDSFGVTYAAGPWWDDPPVRHNDGTTVSWADGHASDYRWLAPETIEFGRRATERYYGGFQPQTPEGQQDLDDFRRAVWGRLGYEPSQ
jgi:prepilin-type processing-associated H-X9-DG protein